MIVGKMMKKLILVTLMLMIIPIATADQFTIDVETAYTDPYPVEPGQNFILSLQVTNKGNEKVDTVYIELDSSYPFTVLEDSRKSVSNLGGGGNKIIEFNLFIDSSAVSTVYEVPVKIIYGSLSTSIQNIKIRVQGTPQFEILDVKTNEINPGDRESLNIQFQNVGTGTAKRMTATFTSSSDVITPIFSGGSVYISEFKAGEKNWIKFDIIVDQDADYGVYTGTILLKYNDESGSNHTSTYNIGVLISGEPHFDVIKSEINAGNGELEIELINSGTAKGVAIKTELWVNGKLFDTDYVTQVNIDKKSIIKFNIPVKETTGIVKLSFKGADNKEYAQEENIAWKNVSSKSGLLILVIAVIAIFVIWKKPYKKLKWFKKKK